MRTGADGAAREPSDLPLADGGALANARDATRGPMPPVIGRALEPFYRWEIGRRNRAFDRGAGVTRLNVPVISIGNLSVGGTGKTPMVIHIARQLLEAGVRPCIAMRGYGRDTAARRDADETDAYRRAFGDLPIVARPDRAAGIRELAAAGVEFDCVILDDGFQHRQIARDLDIVLIDVSRSPFDDRLLPAGWLREPVESLRRASCVVLTHAEMGAAESREASTVHALPRSHDAASTGARTGAGGNSSTGSSTLVTLTNHVTRSHGRPPIAITRHVWTSLHVHTQTDEQESVQPLDWLLGKRILAVCAIGNPDGFLQALRATISGDKSRAGQICEFIVLRDHDPYTPSTVSRIVDAARQHHADAIVTTDKDWSKLRNTATGPTRQGDPSRTNADGWPCPVVRPELAIVFDSGHVALRMLVLAAVAAAT